jgi:hypothetical protein
MRCRLADSDVSRIQHPTITVYDVIEDVTRGSYTLTTPEIRQQ